MQIKSKHHTYSFFLLLTVILSSCISDFDYDVESPKPIPVVNAILFADSVFQIDISWSGTPSANSFEPVTDAEINAFSDGEPLTLSNSGDNGIYTFDHIITPYKKYSINIGIPGENKISANTYIPVNPVIKCNKTDYENYHTLYSLNIDSVDSGTHALYFFMFYKDQSGKWDQASLYCNSPFTDAFNRYFDPDAPAGFSFLYDYFVRIPAKNIMNKKSTTELIPLGGSNGHYKLYVISATKEYDIYYKAAYLQRSFDPETDTPFGFNTIQPPGNISGSPGVFCGANIVLFDFDSEQHQ